MDVLYYFWYWMGYYENSTNTILCVNSLAPTNKELNYAMMRVYSKEDEDDPISSDEQDEIYFSKYYD